MNQLIVGIWVPLWQLLSGSNILSRKVAKEYPREEYHSDESTKPVWSTVCLSGLLLGSAMVARGEIGLLIVEVGYNETSYVSEDAFITAVWAILLNTVLGPVTVGLLMKFHGKEIGEGAWGLQGTAPAAGDDSSIDPSLG